MTLPPILGVSVHSQKATARPHLSQSDSCTHALGCCGKPAELAWHRGEVCVQTGAGLHKDRAVLAEPADPGTER